MEELNKFQEKCLVATAATDKPSGQTILRWLEDADLGVDRVNHGRLYPNLDELVENGFVEKGEKDYRTNYYEITDAGVEQLKAEHAFIGQVL